MTIGETDDNNVEITAGINDGDQIITSNTSTLQDGNEVDAVVKQDSDTTDSTSDKQDGGADDTASK
ncbi:hypothetical protein CLOBL_47700 [Clostridium sp. BL-8]|nr:hypothetical protein CLOBL_47700 [Clostridium sp. BL-8]